MPIKNRNKKNIQLNLKIITVAFTKVIPPIRWLFITLKIINIGSERSKCLLISPSLSDSRSAWDSTKFHLISCRQVKLVSVAGMVAKHLHLASRLWRAPNLRAWISHLTYATNLANLFVRFSIYWARLFWIIQRGSRLQSASLAGHLLPPSILPGN